MDGAEHRSDDERQHEADGHREARGNDEPRPQRQPAGVGPQLEHADETEDRRHEREVERDKALRVAARQRRDVDDVQAPVGAERRLACRLGQHPRDRGARGARQQQAGPRPAEHERGVDVLLGDRAARRRLTGVALQAQRAAHLPLDVAQQHALPRRRTADERGRDLMRLGPAERARVRGHEERPEDECRRGDHQGRAVARSRGRHPHGT